MKSKQVQEFKETEIGDVCPFVYGKGLPEKERNTGKIPVYGSNGIVGWHDKSFLNGPCIIIGRKGSIGKIHYSQIPCWPIDTTFYIEDNQNYHLKFIFYLLRFVNLENMDYDTSVPGLNRNAAHEVKISIPEKTGQMRISQVLENLDTKIENLQNQNKVLEQTAQAIFKSWFVDFDGVTEFEDSELGKIPKGWTVKKFSDIANILSGGTPSTQHEEYWNGDVKWIAIDDLKQGIFILDTEKKITQLGLEKSSAKILPKYSIVISARGTVGIFSITSESMTINQSCYGLTGKGIVNEIFLFFLLKFSLINFIQNVHGSVFDTTIRRTFDEINIICPNDEKILQFQNSMKPTLQIILKNQIQIQSLTETRDALLPKLMSGEIRV